MSGSIFSSSSSSSSSLLDAEAGRHLARWLSCLFLPDHGLPLHCRRAAKGVRREEGGVSNYARVLTLLIVTPLQALTLRTHARACSEAITYEG
jgi:hypothetical protein